MDYTVRLVSQFFWNIWSKMKELPKNVKLDFNLRVSSKFYSNIKHLVFINRIAGIFPISVSKNGDYYCLKWSWLRVILGNVFVLIFGDYSIQHFLSSLVIVWVSAILTLVGLILSYHVEVVYNVRLKGLSALLSTMAEILTLSFTWLIGQVSTSILFKEFWKYLLLLNKFDEIVGPIPTKKKIPRLIVLAFAFTFTCLGMDIYMWAEVVVPETGVVQFMWQMVPFYFTYVYTMILQINVWVTVYCITQRLRRLNEILKIYSEFSIGADVDIYLIRKPPINKILRLTDKPLIHCNMLTKSMLKQFIEAFETLTQANLALGNFLGPVLSMLLVNIIACLVITPYVLYQQIVNAKEYDFLFTQSYWMTCHILRLLFLIEPCHSGQYMGKEVKKTINRLATLELPQEVYKQVEILLLIASENKVEFNATGMTTINRRLLPTIGSAVFTYLAILFQYKSTD